MRQRLRIAVAGAGAIGRRHIELVAHHDECELAGIVDPAPGAANVAGQFGAALYASLADLFAHERPDGVIVATPNSLHVEHGLACVAAGVPALIEKPIADSVEAAQRPSSSALSDYAQGRGHRARRAARPAGRHRRHCAAPQT
jgi:predicted dehydrogenase